MVFESEFDEEQQKLRVNFLGSIYGPSIEDYPVSMATAIDKLMEIKKVVRLVLAERREYEYDFKETKMLLEIANVIEKLTREGVISIKNIVIQRCESEAPQRYEFLRTIMGLLRYDPIEAYKRVIRERRHLVVKAQRSDGLQRKCLEHYTANTIEPIIKLLENCELIQLTKNRLSEHKNRALYRQIFHPSIRPNFMYTRYVSMPPATAELLERYKVGESDISIYNIPGKVRRLYHIVPPEFKLSETEYALLDQARLYIGRHEPREFELTEPERVRENLYRIGLDLLTDIANSNNIDITENQLKRLATILTRYTAGLGVLELLLQDENVQDVAVNAPIGVHPIYIFHGDFLECETNLVPSMDDAESWATRFRLRSGRPLDEANPVLDTEIAVPGGRARVAAITRSLSPDGLGFAFRRHREKPWTFPLFINTKMMDSFTAGLMWFIIDGARTLLIAGTRSSGKTALLGSCLVQIMPKIRIITTEDSVTGDCQIVYERNGIMEKSAVGELIDGVIKRYGCDDDFGRELLRKNPENIRVFSIGKDDKVRLSPVSSFIRHKVNKDVYEITTRTGRKIKVTGDHSLFTLGKKGDIEPVKVRDLRIDSYIAVPRIVSIERNDIEHIDILDYADKGYFKGESIKKFIESNWSEIKKYGSKSNCQQWKERSILPTRIIKELMNLGFAFNKDIGFKSSHNSKTIPRILRIDEDILTFFGLWLADGCYDKGSVIISVVDEESRSLVRKIAARFGTSCKMHSDGVSLILYSSTLKYVMQRLGFTGDAYTKRMPEWVYNLSNNQIICILRGLFSGDGYLAKSEAAISLASENLIKDVQTLLLRFGIISRINRMDEKDYTYSCRISALSSLRAFYNIGFLQKDRMEVLKVICGKKSTHDSTDVVPLSSEIKHEMHKYSESFNYSDYITRDNNIGRVKLLSISSVLPNSELASKLSILAQSDIFWDQIREMKRIDFEGFVYDFSVPECENFICENILAHNTLELPVEELHKLGYNVARLKSRSVITHIETELPAEEALRTALRLGDSALIVGEVRSTEAKALYEAMRIGALANVVAGTIHGESAYGVFDRVVNDLQVPPTSFKATDIIVIANMLRSPDGLHSFRRVVEVTEVRKHWKSDPYDEGGFVNLLEYSAIDDVLKPTRTLTMGESHVLNDIAARVRDWKGRWDAVWENINLRSNVLQYLVEYAKAKNNMEILEASTVMESNSQFHIISNDVKEDIGALDSRMIFDRWQRWLKSRY